LTFNIISKRNLGKHIRGVPLKVYIKTGLGDVTGAVRGKVTIHFSLSAFLSGHLNL
jgi:hypothetical protein